MSWDDDERDRVNYWYFAAAALVVLACAIGWIVGTSMASVVRGWGW